MTVHDIPAINATLNAIATVLIISGLVAIKSRKEKLHRALMIASIVVSAIFLVGYLYHKYVVAKVHTEFLGEGFIRYIYYPMLISHIILAMTIVPLVGRTVWLAIKDKRDLHRKWAKITYPIWLYVSITGVLVYEFLYVWYPSQ